MTTDKARAELERIRDQIWTIYLALKRYKESPSENTAENIEKQFNDIFQQKISSATLNRQLEKLMNRVRGQYIIPRLAIIIYQRALAAVSDPPKLFPFVPNPNETILRFDRQQLIG